jgi:hypothetical protein
MYMRVPVTMIVIVSMKSAASSASACERRNCVQVVAARSGAAGMQVAVPAQDRVGSHQQPQTAGWVWAAGAAAQPATSRSHRRP